MNSNFRCCVLSLSLLAGIAAPWAAIAASTDDRITQLERISNAQGQLLTQLQQQLSDSQRDIDTLRGQIQTNQYQLEQIVERQKIILQQIDELGTKGASLRLLPRLTAVRQGRQQVLLLRQPLPATRSRTTTMPLRW